MSRCRLELKASPGFAGVLVALHAGAAACAALVLPGPAGVALAAALLALGVVAAWDRALLRGRRSVRAVELVGPGRVVVELADGERCEVAAAARRFVSGRLVTVGLGSPLRRTLAVAWGMLDEDAFRLLRIWALWGRAPGVAAPQLPG